MTIDRSPKQAIYKLKNVSRYLSSLANCFYEVGNPRMHDDLASQAVQIEIGIGVFSELIYAIWNANDLETLCHLVGPSKEENEGLMVYGNPPLFLTRQRRSE